VVGPTASGKTALAVSLAEYYGAEVVSADSMQIYRGMDIATAKPSAEEMRGVPHHLLDFVDPAESYSVAAFCADAAKAVNGIVSRGRRVILAGGTGLYVDAFLSGLSFREETESGALRTALLARREAEGIEALYEELKALDPQTAAAIHIHNEKRVLRALELYYATGETPAAVRASAKEGISPYRSETIGLFFEDRALLYDRINARVERMLAAGLAEEARRFYAANPAGTAAQAIGYKELKPWLDGEITLETAAENLKRATRRYAKRQLTWFGRNEKIHRIYRDGLSDAEVFEAARRIADETNLFHGR
jgi:tRNA dimethylallyltransferase